MTRFSIGHQAVDSVHSSFRSCVCSHCNDCRELDLCRDPALQKGSWACPCCQAQYDAAAIEARLVAALQGRIKEFVLQDLSCTQCKQVCRSAAGNSSQMARHGMQSRDAKREVRLPMHIMYPVSKTLESYAV